MSTVPMRSMATARSAPIPARGGGQESGGRQTRAAPEAASPTRIRAAQDWNRPASASATSPSEAAAAVVPSQPAQRSRALSAGCFASPRLRLPGRWDRVVSHLFQGEAALLDRGPGAVVRADVVHPPVQLDLVAVRVQELDAGVAPEQMQTLEDDRDLAAPQELASGE